MAKLIVTSKGHRLWALTKSEDYLLIDAYMLIKRYVPNYDHGFQEFGRRYFDDGSMLSDKFLIMLNSILTRKGYDPLLLREGHSDSYTILKGWPKAQERTRIREALEDMNDADRALVLDAKAQDVNRQIDRDVVYDAIKAARQTSLTPVGMGKVATTALTEQLIGAMERGALEPHAALARDVVEPALVQRDDKRSGLAVQNREPPVLAASAGDAPPADPELVDIGTQLEKRPRTSTVKLAMLAAVQAEVSAIRDEMATLRAVQEENGALHAAVAEVERLKWIIAANQDEVRILRTALHAFQRSVMQVAIAA